MSVLGAWCAARLACSRSASPEGGSLDRRAYGKVLNKSNGRPLLGAKLLP